jgi:hypothetical protein
MDERSSVSLFDHVSPLLPVSSCKLSLPFCCNAIDITQNYHSENHSFCIFYPLFAFSNLLIQAIATETMLTRTFTVVTLLAASAHAFHIAPPSHRPSTATLHMGLFDGVKEAFSAPALERSSIDSERETPIDRWMGWSVVSDKEVQQPTKVAGK